MNLNNKENFLTVVLECFTNPSCLIKMMLSSLATGKTQTAFLINNFNFVHFVEYQ